MLDQWTLTDQNRRLALHDAGSDHGPYCAVWTGNETSNVAGGWFGVGHRSYFDMILIQRRYDKDHVMSHTYINQHVLHTFLH